MKIKLTRHAKNKFRFYKLPEQFIDDIVNNPDEKSTDTEGRLLHFKSISDRRFVAVIVKEKTKVILITIFPAKKRRIS